MTTGKMPQGMDDRVHGFVVLSVNGAFYAPNFRGNKREPMTFSEYKKHWIAWRILMKRTFGKQHEPCNLRHVIEKRQML